MNELQAHEIEELDVFGDEQQEAFRISDLEGLNWTFRKLNAIKAAIKDKKQLAEAEHTRIDEWLTRTTAPLEMDAQYFEHLIKQYHEEELAADPKKKSISTPYGKVKSTTTKAQPEKADESQLLHYVKANDLPFVETKESLKWGDLKKSLKVVELGEELTVVDEFGQIVPGVIVKPQTTTFKVEVDV